MTCTYLFGTGFELGTVPFSAAYMSEDRVSVDASPAHTGNYSLGLAADEASDAYGQFDVPGTPTSLYVSTWIHPGAGAEPGASRVQLILADAKVIEVRLAGTHWNAYVDGALVATGAYDVADLAAWHHLELYAYITNSGRLRTRINGRDDIDYSGDTQPGASTAIAYLRLLNYQGNGAVLHVDDVAFGTGDWCGDVRCDLVVPNADTATLEWTPSSIGDHYPMVDDVPADDGDYVEGLGDGDQDLYEVAAWAGVHGQNEPLFVGQWTRADKSAAAADQVKQLLQSGGTLSTGSAASLVNGTPTYVYRLLATDPATARAWLLAALQSLQIGQEAVIAP
jgi:hypothetical protein